ncbi:ABC transporter permease [Pediococcus claussenii]|uniref:ABC transporter permease n=1 Tax=Pediococcus claussenii TaxID=187452 RepID=UPI00081A3C03|nr:FtsX-like permease family protein [Pediococcus claussenii]ANZ69222.1 ABC transporter permease [Pediococcus claussenii]ANZ71041.1 ABC transporter permease [Pediococcus claussenii]
MFLAIKEIKKEKLRYGLIIGMIVLISYLIFILTSLSLGLAQQNTNAINSWNVHNIILNKDSNINLNQSLITEAQLKKQPMTDKEAPIGATSAVVKDKSKKKISATFIGLNTNQFIAQNIHLSKGHHFKSENEVVVDDQFQQSGYRLGDHITLNDNSKTYTIVGFTPKAEINIAPIVYGKLSAWKTLNSTQPNIAASAIVSKNKNVKTTSPLKSYGINTFIQKLPGYSAQNLTFSLMIGFLMIISLIVIAVFLYIITIQKLPNYAVLRAQGIPGKVLVISTFAQSVILVISGLVISSILTMLTALVLPSAVPIAFDLPVLFGVGLGIILTSLLGGLLPIRSVIKVDPISVIGG